MATSLMQWDATAARFPTSNYGALLATNTIPVVWLDASTAETLYLDGQVPQNISGASTLVMKFIMASATSGKADVEVQVMAVTPGDALDLDSATSYDTANGVTAPTVPGVAGYMFEISCTLTNADGWAAGDWVRLAIKRDATDATNDTASGDLGFVAAEWRQ